MGTSKVWHNQYEAGVPTEVGWPDERLDHLLKRSAEKYPDKSAIVFFEDALFEHPGVVDVGVMGIPVGGQDQRVKAFVVLEDGAAPSEDELIEFCRERSARYKLPRAIVFRKELPKTSVGKLLRRELMAEEQAQQG